MVSKDSLLKIKQDVESYVGQEICVKANIGRNKCIFRKGVIDSTYPNLFVFKESDTDNKLSYSYTDLVTNNLQLSLPTGEMLTNYDFSTPKYTRL
ncbi:MAG: Veg family protein [Clostridia bacterium]